jgi:hypothetical protein
MISSVLLILLEAEIVFGAGVAQLRRRENDGIEATIYIRKCERSAGAFGDIATSAGGSDGCAVGRRDERA